MKNNATNPFCMLFGHNYFVHEKNDHSSKLRCKSCKSEFILNENGKLLDVGKTYLDSYFFS